MRHGTTGVMLCRYCSHEVFVYKRERQRKNYVESAVHGIVWGTCTQEQLVSYTAYLSLLHEVRTRSTAVYLANVMPATTQDSGTT